jgi:hypothetical protein
MPACLLRRALTGASLSVLTALAVTPPTVLAADPPAKAPTARPAPAKPPGAKPAAAKPAAAAAAASAAEPVMSRDELRACLQRAERIRGLEAQAVERQAGLDRDEADIRRLDAELGREEATLDRSKPELVAAFTAKEEALKARMAAYNEALPRFNTLAGELETARRTQKAECADRAFEERDEKAIRRGR